MRKVRPPLPLGVPDALALRPTGVSLGIYATVLQGYGMLDRLASLAEARLDPRAAR